MRNKLGIFVSYLLLIGVVGIFLAPFLWTLFTSLKPNAEIYSETMKILPTQIDFSHYVNVITQMKDFYSYFFNSVSITFWTLLLVGTLSSLTGYAFGGSFHFPGQGIILGFILLVLTLPYAIYLIPVYMMQDKMNLIDTHLGLILPYTAINLPMAILIMRGSFRNIPRELEEAAIIDGCSMFQVWYKIMLPMVKPGFAIVMILTFINVWGEFMFARTLTNSPAATTLSVGITYLRDEAASWQYGTLTAAITLSLFPPLVTFLVMQKYFVKGIIEGALKG